MIKTHNITGMKYLCYTQKEDHNTYKGSGKFWKRHLKKHGDNFTTELIFECEDLNTLKEYARNKSIEYNIVESEKWANLRIEDGDGGNTVSNKRWITNGIIDVYVDKNSHLEEGWKYGRSNCIFNNVEKQKEFSARSDRKKAGESTHKSWKDGKVIRDHSKCGSKGDKNPTKRPEVKEKIRQYQLNKKPKYCEKCDRWYKNMYLHLTRSKNHNE